MAKPAPERELFEGLSVREARFVHEYLSNGGNTGKALVAAGYSRQTQNPMFKPHVRRACREWFRKYAEEQGVTAQRVIAETAMIAFAPVDDPNITVKDKLRALEYLGKHYQLFNDRIDLTLRNQWQVEVRLESLSDGELAELERISGKATTNGTPSGPETNGSHA